MWKYSLAILIVASFTACDDSNAKSTVKDTAPSTYQSNNADSLNEEFGGMINEYYLLKDNFIVEDEHKIIECANAMKMAADTLNLIGMKSTNEELKKNNQLIEDIKTDLKTLLEVKDMELQRKSFRAISDKLYDLIKAIHYDKQIIYREYCPMALNESGADWLSNTGDIKNPYIPKKMIDCGEIKDTIDFTKP